MLESIRAAVGNDANDVRAEYASLQRAYGSRGAMSVGDCVGLMMERLREYDADVVECAVDLLPDAIAAQVQKCGRRLLVVPSGLPHEWMVRGPEWKVDRGLTHEEIEQADGVVTGATCGIADSGTIVLHHSAAEGRRVLSLLPDWHLCIVRASQLVETLPEYFERCGTAPSLATFISGPSATADIEMTRIKGVHGPRFLNVVMVRDE
jgi:L-lactate dehydrogenase complex protein LldG